MNISKNIFAFVLALLVSFQMNAQDVPAPGDAQTERVILKGATIHIGNGEVIEDGVIVFENGKISKVHSGLVKVAYPESQTIDVKGKHIYPGLITPNSLLGMVEIGAVRATRDNREIGYLNPNVRSIIAYNTDSKVIPTVRSNGVLLAQVKPEGGRISGSSSVVQLDAWNWEDAIVREDDGIYVNWPALFRRSGWWAEPGGIKLNKDYEKDVAELRSFLGEAAAYSTQAKMAKKRNLKMASMAGLFSGENRLFIVADQHKQIIDAIQICKDLGIKMVLVGGRDAWLIPELLVENNIPVILRHAHNLPGMEDDDIDIIFRLPALMQEAGVLFCQSARNDSGEQRNLPFVAGKSVAYGLDKEIALQSVTLNTAKILGIDDKVGSLEEGKSATLIVSTGDVLDISGNNIELAFIDGRVVSMNNKQKDLYMKFMKKYKLDYVAP